MTPTVYSRPAVERVSRSTLELAPRFPQGAAHVQAPDSGCVVLAVASTGVIAACSSDTPTSPPTAWKRLAATAPAIGLSRTWFDLCYPARAYSTRACPSAGNLSIGNTGGGTLDWTASKSASWLKISPKSGTAPSTVKFWVDGAGLPPGSYTARIKVWSAGATNSPRAAVVNLTVR